MSSEDGERWERISSGSNEPWIWFGLEWLSRPALRRLLISTLLLCVLCLDSARSDDEAIHELPIQLTADTLEHQRDRDLYVATGNVRIVRGDRSINADWAVFSTVTERGIATGNVIYRDGSEELLAEFLQFDIDTIRGMVYRAYLDTGEGSFLVDADRIMRTGEDRYTVRGGVFTTCRCDEDERIPWTLRATDSKVEIGGYATAQNTTVSILGVPVVWLPWMFFPIKTERESGLLFPRFGFTGNNGFGTALPIFWAARENVNVILTPIYMTERGYKQNVRVEYLNGRSSGGDLFAAYVNDQVRKDSGKTGGDENRVNRWAFLLEHDQYLPADWTARADIRLMSDNRYAHDFEELRTYRADHFMESTLFAFRHFSGDGEVGVFASLVHRNDLQAIDSLDRDPIVAHRLPNLHVEALSAPVPIASNWITRFAGDYTYFHRDQLPQDRFSDAAAGGSLYGDSLFMDIGVNAQPYVSEAGGGLPPFNVEAGEDNGIFDEGEPLADRGHRFILHPRIARPMRLFDRFELYPELGYREILYATESQSFAEQGHLTARVDLRSRWIGSLLNGQLEHVVEPLLNWAMVGNASSSGDPIFTPATATPQNRFRQLDRENLIADGADRVNSRNTVAFGIANRFYRSGYLLADLRLSIDYNWMGNGTKGSRTLFDVDYSEFIFSGAVLPIRGVGIKYNFALDIATAKVDSGLASVSWTPVQWLKLASSYRYRAPIPANTARFFQEIINSPWNRATDPLSEVGSSGRLNLGRRMSLHYRAIYDLAQKNLVRNQGSVEYRGRCNCWAVGVQVNDERNGEVRYLGFVTVLGVGVDDVANSPFNTGNF